MEHIPIFTHDARRVNLIRRGGIVTLTARPGFETAPVMLLADQRIVVAPSPTDERKL